MGALVVLISLVGVTKVFKPDIIALRGITLMIEKGEFVFITGPTGSGKTTLLRILIGDVVPTKGRVIVNDVDLVKLPRRKLPFFRRDIGVIFQDYKLLPHKTAFENVAFVLEAVGVPPKETKERVMEILSIVGLLHRRRLFPEQLSGGEQQKLAIARAIVNSPSILIADEPTGNLDPDTAWDIAELLLDINSRGTTVLVATHNKTLVDELKKRVITLKDGELVRDEKEGTYYGEE